MTDFLVLVVTFIAAVNPAWAALVYDRLHDQAGAQSLDGRTVPVTVGVTIAAVLLLAAALLADPLLDALSIEPETFRVAAGIVMAGMGVTAIIGRRPIEIDHPEEWSRGIYPLAIPLFAGPAALVAAIIYSVDEGAAATVAAAAVALTVAAALSLVTTPRAKPFLAAGTPLLAALLVLIAAGLVVDGVQAI